MEPLDLSPRPGQYRPALYYWLAALNYCSYVEPDGRLHTVLNCIRRPWRYVADGRHIITPIFEQGTAPWNYQWRETVTGRAIGIVCDRYIILVARGTVTWTELLFQMAEVNNTDEVPGAGEANVTTRRHALGLLEALWPHMETDAEGRRVLLTGHSMGGSCAQIMAHYISHRELANLAGVVTYACPRVGNSEFARANTWPVHRIEVERDPIPHLPPEFRIRRLPRLSELIEDTVYGYRHAGEEFQILTNGNLLSSRPEGHGLDSGEVDNPLRNQTAHWYPYNTHSPQNYLLAARSRLPNDIRELPETQIDLVALDRISQALVEENEGWTWPFVSQVNYVQPARPRGPRYAATEPTPRTPAQRHGIGYMGTGTPGRSTRRRRL